MSERKTATMGRVPPSLQAIFLASNRGLEAHVPPPNGVATKVFYRNWFFQKSRTTSQVGKGLLKEQGSSIRSSTETVLTSSDSVSSTSSAPPSMEPSRPARNIKSKARATKPGSVQKTSSSERLMQRSKSSKSMRKLKVVDHVMPPQEFLDKILHARGYSTERFETLKTSYYNNPTPLQIASYDMEILRVVRDKDAHGLRELLAAGLSPNPCNRYGESLVHMVCRRGDVDLLKVMLEFGCTVQVADDCGRTPLHDAFWAATPNWEVVELLMKQDIRLFYMADSRGSLPLNFCRKEHYAKWVQFLQSKSYWFPRTFLIEGEEEAPSLTLQGPNTKPVPDPPNALSVELAQMLAKGEISAAEAIFLKEKGVRDSDDMNDESESSECDGEDDGEEDEGSDDDNDDDEVDDDEFDFSFDEEVDNLLNALTNVRSRKQ